MSVKRRPAQGPKIGLALGGGGAKGLAHIGILKVLEEWNFPIYCIAGTSVGALVGGAYASGVSIEALIRVARKIRWSDLGRITLSKVGVRDGSRMEEFIREHFPVTTFEELRIPLAVVAADILTGEKCIIDRGDLARAIRTSCAIPGYFTPVIDEDNRMLVDGGIVDSLPVSVVTSMGAERAIAVNVHPFSKLDRPPTNLFQIHNQAYAIMGHNAAAQSRKSADVLITPDLSHIPWDDLERADEIIAAGETAMRRSRRQCQRLLERKRGGILSRLRAAFAR